MYIHADSALFCENKAQDLRMLIYEITDAFKLNKIKYAIVGGYAMALHGLVRATIDIDFVLKLTKRDFEAVEQILQKIGLQSRLPVRAKDIISMRQEYIEDRNLIAWSFVDYKNPTRQIDILITKDLSDLEVEKIKVGSRSLSVISLEELLRMKMEAGRPQDLLDIKNIEIKLSEEKKKKS
jgi:hypothetical protein